MFDSATTADQIGIGQEFNPTYCRLLNAEELAAALHTSTTRIYLMAAAGEIPSPTPHTARRKQKRDWRWSAPIIARWIQEGCPALEQQYGLRAA